MTESHGDRGLITGTVTLKRPAGEILFEQEWVVSQPNLEGNGDEKGRPVPAQPSHCGRGVRPSDAHAHKLISALNVPNGDLTSQVSMAGTNNSKTVLLERDFDLSGFLRRKVDIAVDTQTAFVPVELYHTTLTHRKRRRPMFWMTSQPVQHFVSLAFKQKYDVEQTVTGAAQMSTSKSPKSAPPSSKSASSVCGSSCGSSVPLSVAGSAALASLPPSIPAMALPSRTPPVTPSAVCAAPARKPPPPRCCAFIDFEVRRDPRH